MYGLLAMIDAMRQVRGEYGRRQVPAATWHWPTAMAVSSPANARCCSAAPPPLDPRRDSPCPSTVCGSTLFRDMFGTPEMRDVISDEGYLQACLDTEAALARAQASVGMIPIEAAREITSKAQLACLDMGRFKAECENVGYPIVGLATQLAQACAGEAGGYVHWGATTQDIMDTAVVLQVRRALELVEADLVQCVALLGGPAKRHRDVPMAGHTHLQHALPVTFGYKVAI